MQDAGSGGGREAIKYWTLDGGKEAARSPEKEGQQQNAETLEGVLSWRPWKEVTDAGNA